MKRMFFKHLREGMSFYKKIKFVKKEITFYSDFSGDTNSIHVGSNPVVPGALILFKIAGLVSKKFADKSMVTEIVSKFKRPLFLGERVFAIFKIAKKICVGSERGTIILDIHIRNNRNKLLFVGGCKVKVPTIEMRQTTAIAVR